MARFWTIILFSSALFAGCGAQTAHMSQPEDPERRYRDHIRGGEARAGTE